MTKKEPKNKINGFTTWIFIRVLGFSFLLFGLFIVVSLISHNNLDPYYGYYTSGEIKNVTGFYGSYISGTLLNYFDISSFLIPIFLILWGINFIFGIKINYKFFKFFSLFILIFICSCVYAGFSFYENIFGNFLFKILLLNLFNSINNFYIIAFCQISIGLILIPYMFFILNINNKYFFSCLKIFIKGITKTIYFIIKLFLKIFKTKKIINSFERQEPYFDSQSSPNSIKEYEKPVSLKTAKRKSLVIDKNQGAFNFNESIDYQLPKIDLFKNISHKRENVKESNKDIENKALKLEEVLSEFGVQGKITDVRPGPIVTMYELEPSAGTKAIRIINLADDIARSMSALSARISSQPGRNIIGIELPNQKRSPVFLSDLLSHKNYTNYENNLALALGKNIAGNPVIADLEKMPHLLIAGTTGSGKSVGINSMIISLLYKLKPSECRFILIDPKMLELSIYEDIPHLLTPVVTDPHKAIVALKWVVKEMENRYRLMNHAGVKNIHSYNFKIKNLLQKGTKMYREVTTGIDPDTRLPIVEKKEIPNENFPYIVVVIDEMADLMMVAGKDVELAIQRLAQMARQAGIHLIMATQRPSVDVITGTIKANFPSRISYNVASKFDSRTILNEIGAEQLLGSGDMLFMEQGGKITRLHGGFVSEDEISNIVRFIKNQSRPDYSQDVTTEVGLGSDNLDFNLNTSTVDELYSKAVNLVIMEQKASTSFVQRHLQIGYNRAARIIEQMEKEGIISEANHVGKREVLKSNV